MITAERISYDKTRQAVRILRSSFSLVCKNLQMIKIVFSLKK
jgi:hypothetical protein